MYMWLVYPPKMSVLIHETNYVTAPFLHFGSYGDWLEIHYTCDSYKT